tara:strand:+ start:449 stop:619 length:171 start_codon:yes stop_codon:yes gene_type:complete
MQLYGCTATNIEADTGTRDTQTPDALNKAFDHQDFGVYAEVIAGDDILIRTKAFPI